MEYDDVEEVRKLILELKQGKQAEQEADEKRWPSEETADE